MATDNPFQTSVPSISGNPQLRAPQRETFEALASYANEDKPQEREVGIILPVGCGKSGCITLTPFAFKANRTLVVAPGLNIANQLHEDFDPANPEMFYQKRRVLSSPPFPEPVEIRGRSTNTTDLEEAHVVVTNIQQLQGAENRWLQNLTEDFFDLIVFDEGHHSVANSWTLLKEKFPKAKIVNYSATPQRADGQIMAGRVLYSFPIFRAIQEGYVKQLKAVVLNPATLKYVRREDGNEVEVTLEEVRLLGETDADFRKSIVTSKETLTTIVDASIRELQKKRKETDNKRLKIIASALNYEHCRQIVEAYRARNLNADYVHSREDSATNERILEKLEAHQLDVIVQVRKLGEGFDHPYLSVAAVFSIFANLSPFVQFVGRIMRVIEQNAPQSTLNQGSVIFHAGANVASRWEDFQNFSQADRDFFDQLMPVEGLNFTSASELELEPRPRDTAGDNLNIEDQTDIALQEIPLIRDNPEALAALQLLKDAGYTSTQLQDEFERLQAVPVTKVRQRQAMRASLDQRVKTEVGRILGEHNISYEGKDLDRQRLGRSNFIVLKSAIDREINAFTGKPAQKRDEFTRVELDRLEKEFDKLVSQAVGSVINAKS